MGVHDVVEDLVDAPLRAFAVRAISRHFCFVKRTDRGTVVTTSLLYFTPCPMQRDATTFCDIVQRIIRN
jgi:hypothetical protein